MLWRVKVLTFYGEHIESFFWEQSIKSFLIVLRERGRERERT